MKFATVLMIVVTHSNCGPSDAQHNRSEESETPQLPLDTGAHTHSCGQFGLTCSTSIVEPPPTCGPFELTCSPPEKMIIAGIEIAYPYGLLSLEKAQVTGCESGYHVDIKESRPFQQVNLIEGDSGCSVSIASFSLDDSTFDIPDFFDFESGSTVEVTSTDSLSIAELSVESQLTGTYTTSTKQGVKFTIKILAPEYRVSPKFCEPVQCLDQDNPVFSCRSNWETIGKVFNPSKTIFDTIGVIGGTECDAIKKVRASVCQNYRNNPTGKHSGVRCCPAGVNFCSFDSATPVTINL